MMNRMRVSIYERYNVFLFPFGPHFEGGQHEVHDRLTINDHRLWIAYHLTTSSYGT